MVVVAAAMRATGGQILARAPVRHSSRALMGESLGARSPPCRSRAPPCRACTSARGAPARARGGAARGRRARRRAACRPPPSTWSSCCSARPPPSRSAWASRPAEPRAARECGAGASCARSVAGTRAFGTYFLNHLFFLLPPLTGRGASAHSKRARATRRAGDAPGRARPAAAGRGAGARRAVVGRSPQLGRTARSAQGVGLPPHLTCAFSRAPRPCRARGRQDSTRRVLASAPTLSPTSSPIL